MTYAPRNTYLESKVTTASQPRLHLMLLEGAIRNGQLASQAWDDESRFSEVELALCKMIDIAEELVRAVGNCTTPVSQQLEDQYAAIFRQLAFCQVNRDRSRLVACLELLEFHRETWKMLCDNIERTDGKPHISAPASLRAGAADHLAEGFSCQA